MSTNTRYTVKGELPVLGHQPGTTFSADIPEDQEAFLLNIGALERTVEIEKDPKRPNPPKPKG